MPNDPKPALTIVSCPKAFKEDSNRLQRNAIRSWTLLVPKPEIILIGDDAGTAEICAEFKLRHVPEVKRNASNIPFVDDVFYLAQCHATADYLLYVNADIILTNPILDAFSIVKSRFDQFLMIQERVGIHVDGYLPYDEECYRMLEELNKQNVRHGGIDAFLYPKTLLPHVPPFYLGRMHWDHWLLHEAVETDIPLIDTSPFIQIFHQEHGYNYQVNNENPEVLYNAAIAAELGYYMNPVLKRGSANWELTETGELRPVARQQLTPSQREEMLKNQREVLEAWKQHQQHSN